jgi:hypothetical protein
MRKIAERESQSFAKMFSHGSNDRIGSPAIIAFIVAVLEKRERRIDPSPNMVSLGNGY